MRKADKAPITITLIFLMVVVMSALLFCFAGAQEDEAEDRAEQAERDRIDLAKQDIVSEYGFDPVIWLNIEKVNNIEGRDDFYIFTCLVDEGELREYRFAVVIREVNGEIDVDTWLIREG